MTAHLSLDLHGGFASVARVIARLHALGVTVCDLEVSGTQMCLHLPDGATRGRVTSVLGKLVDVAVRHDLDNEPVGTTTEPLWLHTTYAVMTERVPIGV